jgi:hypothetical protein
MLAASAAAAAAAAEVTVAVAAVAAVTNLSACTDQTARPTAVRYFEGPKAASTTSARTAKRSTTRGHSPRSVGGWQVVTGGGALRERARARCLRAVQVVFPLVQRHTCRSGAARWRARAPGTPLTKRVGGAIALNIAGHHRFNELANAAFQPARQLQSPQKQFLRLCISANIHRACSSPLYSRTSSSPECVCVVVVTRGDGHTGCLYSRAAQSLRRVLRSGGTRGPHTRGVIDVLHGVAATRGRHYTGSTHTGCD